MPFPTIRRWSAVSALLGGLLWIILWSLHTIAHGPSNPAPTGRTVWGHTSEAWAMTMLRVAPLPLLIGILGLFQLHRHRLGVVGRGRAVLCFTGLAMLLLAGFGIVGWLLYALGSAVTYLGLILFGLSVVRARLLPPWCRAVPLLMGCLGPLIDLARQPGSPLLKSDDLVGYLLLESYGVVFGLGWILLGLGLWSAGAPSLHRGYR